MKYTKVIFIFLISFSAIKLLAKEALTQESSDQSIQDFLSELKTSYENRSEKTADIDVTSNELQEWQNHLDTIDKNWDASTNIPDENWTQKAIDIATTILKSKPELLDTFEKEFFNAMSNKTTKLTSNIFNVINDFNTQARQAAGKSPDISQQETEEPIAEEAEEYEKQLAASIQAPETITAKTEESTATKVGETTAKTSTAETTAEATTVSTQQPEEKEVTVQDWQNCIRDIKNKQFNNLSDALTAANDVAKKLKESGKMATKSLIKDFNNALDLCMAQKRLDEISRSIAVSEFMSALNIYTPVLPAPTSSYYQPTELFAENITTQKNTAEIERKLAEQEEAIKAAAQEDQRQKEEIIRQAALLRAAQAGHISQNQWQQAELSRQRAEQAREAESLRQTQEAAQKLALQLKTSAAEQKATAEKSIFTRAKETISGFIFGPATPSVSPQQIAKENSNLLEEMVKSQPNLAIANAIKDAFTTFQHTLFAFKQPMYWDSQKSCPKELWVDTIKNNLLILIQYKILPVTEAIDVVIKALDSYPQMDNLAKSNIKESLRKALKKEEVQVQQREQTKKRQILQKKIAEEKQMEEKRARMNEEMLQRETARKLQLAAEEQEKQKAFAKQDFDKQMQEWLNLMYQIENVANPTNDHNRKITMQAIQKAEVLIRLAQQFRSKQDVKRAEEKLKQDFINSLLRQQAAHQHSLNIYENQRQFDTAINSMI